MLKDVREDAAILLQDPKKELHSFRLALTTPLGTKRGRGQGAAIDSLLAAVDGFYIDILQNLKAWTATPPKMREAAELPEDTPPVLTSTALSSQDGIEPAPSSPPAAGQPPSTATASYAEMGWAGRRPTRAMARLVHDLCTELAELDASRRHGPTRAGTKVLMGQCL